MPTFVFWNINEKPLAERIARIAVSHAVDVVVLAESAIEPGAMLEAFVKLGAEGFVPLIPQAEKFISTIGPSGNGITDSMANAGNSTAFWGNRLRRYYSRLLIYRANFVRMRRIRNRKPWT
jgi:hypothetical protein